MGLEMVEFVMEVEDEFGIQIDDLDLDGEPALTVGAFYQVVLRIIRTNPDSPWAKRPDLESAVWKRITEIVVEQTRGVKPEQITAETRFSEDLGFG